MAPVISVHGLSKRYRLKHVARPRYESFREVISGNVSRFFRNGFGRPVMPVDGKEEDFWALKDVNFSVERGDRLGIVGRNGAGKSTLLKILSRITDPTKGRVEIRGRVSSLLEVGTGFHPELSGRENIFLNGAILGMRTAEVRRKFEQIVHFAEIERFLDTPVKRYSSGMYVRLAFAVAAHLEPDILIVDEVLAVGDSQFQQKCLGRMEELSHSGRTILFVTHNMDAMLTLCNRGVVLDRGAVVFDGTASESRGIYLNSAVQAEYSITKNSGRGGSGGATISGVWIENDMAENVHSSMSGDSLRVCLDAIISDSFSARKDLQVAFGIDSIEGTRLYTVLSSWSLTAVEVVDGALRVACDIDQFPLVPGKYLVSATLLFHGDTLDSIQHCASFELLPTPRATHVERLHGWGALDLSGKFLNRNH